jgi:hypothetical protein
MYDILSPWLFIYDQSKGRVGYLVHTAQPAGKICSVLYHFSKLNIISIICRTFHVKIDNRMNMFYFHDSRQKMCVMHLTKITICLLSLTLRLAFFLGTTFTVSND